MKNIVCFIIMSLVVFPVFAQDSAQSQATGLLDDATWSIMNRTVYERRDYEKGDKSNGGTNKNLPKTQRSDFAEEWAYGLMGKIESGYTPGFIGFGIDVHGYLGVKLDSSGARAGKARLLAVNSDGNPKDQFGRAGVVGKIRVADTTLKYGEQRVKTPIFSSSDSRLLPETATGLFIQSNEINKLTLQAGHFTGSADRHSGSNNNDLIVNYSSGKKGNYFNLIGGVYKGIPNLSVSLYGGKYHNNWYSAYLGTYYTHKFNEDQALIFDLNLYHAKNTGASYSGDISNITGSLVGSYRYKGHTFGLGYQKVHSDTPFDYVTRGAIWLGNAAQLSDFNAPHEQSWQLRYDLDFADYGVNGLVFTGQYFKGSGIDGTRMRANSGYAYLGYGKDGRHWERDLQLKYIIQSGKAKNMAVVLRYNTHRNNKAQAELNTNQVRLALEFPLNGKVPLPN